MNKKLKIPSFGDELPPAQPSRKALDLLQLRRSTPADFLTEPGPDESELQAILTTAARTPDHRRVTPFRFVVFRDEARRKFGETLKQAFLATEPDAESHRASYEANRFLRAPVVVAVISSVNRNHKTPEWEQVLTAGAVCQTMLLATSAHGFAAQWLTEWYAYDQSVLDALGLSAGERIAGYIYIGAAKESPRERARADMAAITTFY